MDNQEEEDNVQFLKQLLEYYIHDGMKHGPSINTWTNRRLFYKDRVRRGMMPRYDNPDQLFRKMETQFQRFKQDKKGTSPFAPTTVLHWHIFQISSRLWDDEDVNRTSSSSYNDALNDYMELELSDSHLDPPTLADKQKDIALLKEMIHFYIHRSCKKTGHRTQSHVNIRRFLCNKFGTGGTPPPPPLDQEEVKDLLLHQMEDMYRRFVEFDLRDDRCRSQTDLEIFHLSFQLWGHEFTGGPFRGDPVDANSVIEEDDLTLYKALEDKLRISK